MVQSWRNFAQLRKQQSSYFITTNDLDYGFEKEFLLCENSEYFCSYNKAKMQVIKYNNYALPVYQICPGHSRKQPDLTFFIEIK